MLHNDLITTTTKITTATNTQATMGGGNEQEDDDDLNTTLIDPESLDNPTPQYQKGSLQESKCRDAWAAILFYAQLIAIGCVCGIFGVPAIQKNISSAADSGGEEPVGNNKTDYIGLIYSEFMSYIFFLIS